MPAADGRPAPPRALSATFAATLARLGALDIDARLAAPRAPEWIRRDDLLAPGALEQAMARVGAAAETGIAAIQGTWLLEGYVYALLRPAIAALLTERRVPDLGAGNVALRRDDPGDPDAVAFATACFAALPGDAAARAAGATIVDDDRALAAWLRAGIVGHLAPLVAALRERCRRGERALWASVEDTCSGLLLWTGESLGDPAAACGLAGLILGAEPPLAGPAVYVEVTHAGGSELLRHRNGCCLAFRCENGDGVACLTCPRTSMDERRRRLSE